MVSCLSYPLFALVHLFVRRLLLNLALLFGCFPADLSEVLLALQRRSEFFFHMALAPHGLFAPSLLGQLRGEQMPSSKSTRISLVYFHRAHFRCQAPDIAVLPNFARGCAFSLPRDRKRSASAESARLLAREPVVNFQFVCKMKIRNAQVQLDLTTGTCFFRNWRNEDVRDWATTRFDAGRKVVLLVLIPDICSRFLCTSLDSFLLYVGLL